MTGKYFHAFLISTGIACACLLLFSFRFFESWQMQLSDLLFLPRPNHPDIVIIAIDDKSIQNIGRWPWDRAVHGKLIALLADKPAAIGLDVAFPESSNPDSDAQLTAALAATSSEVIPLEANKLNPQQDVVVIRDYLFPHSQFLIVSDAGLVNMATDHDSITRLSPINIKTDKGDVVKNFSMLVLEKYYAAKKGSVPTDIPTERGMLRINYTGPPQTYPSYSYLDVLEGVVEPEEFEGKIVLIGSTALDLHDNLLTPVSGGVPMSGVEVHANVLQTILEKDYLHREPAYMTMVSIAVLAIISAAIFVYFEFLFGIIALFIFLGGHVLFSILSFDAGVIRNIVYPALTIISVFVSIVIYKYAVENRQKRFIRKAFSYYLSESVLKELLSNPKKLSLGGERKELTVLFSDIVGFTTISENLAPERLASIINEYLTTMTKIVFEYKGVLDKYIGDALMAFWGAPIPQKDHAFLACQAAIKMQDELEAMKAHLMQNDLDDFKVRIGINTGDMVVGNMGSELRFDYTLLGDNVNLASRLESINREYGTNIIISEATYNQVKDHVVARRLDMVAVKGKSQVVSIYELRKLGQPTEGELEFLKQFEQARLLYEEGKFKRALGEFEKIKNYVPYDAPTKVYISRCKRLLEEKPKEWDGVYRSLGK